MKKYTPVIILGLIALGCVVALSALAYAPGQETQFIQNSLASLAGVAVGAIAGLVRAPSEETQAVELKPEIRVDAVAPTAEGQLEYAHEKLREEVDKKINEKFDNFVGDLRRADARRSRQDEGVSRPPHISERE